MRKNTTSLDQRQCTKEARVAQILQLPQELKAIVILIIGCLAVSCWYFGFLRENLVLFFPDYRSLSWVLSLIQWGCVVLYGGLERDLVKAYCMMTTFEYGFLFMVNGNDSFDLYPFADVVFAKGLLGRLLAVGLVASCLVLLQFRRPVVNWLHRRFFQMT